jgi:ribonuclease Z
MNLVVLGSGTANPHPERGSAGFWLEADAAKLLLDIGATVPHRLAQERLDWGNFDSIWVSHFHIDHCLGLAALLFATRHAPETRNRSKPLRILGGKGLQDLFDKFDDAAAGKLRQQPFPLEFIEIEPLEKFEIASGLTAVALKTPHTDNSYAIRIEDAEGTVVVYTSDTGFANEIALFAKDCDLLIIESSFVKEKKTQFHLELAEAMYLIRKAKPKRAMLTHLYYEWDSVDFCEEVARFEPACEVLEARDGARLEI